jgi:quercetin dioxygenase-like cupin family protein
VSQRARRGRGDCARGSLNPKTMNMKHLMIGLGLLSGAGIATASDGSATQTQPGRSVVVTRNGSRPSQVGPAATFTGVVRIDPVFDATDSSRAAAATVTFEPGARTAWHSHPRGQRLVVTSGLGRVQSWGSPVAEIRPGDVVWIPAGVKHWHGASPTTAMTHIAVQEHLNGNVVTWLEHVTADQYAAKPEAK